MNKTSSILNAVTDPLLQKNAESMGLESQCKEDNAKISLDLLAGFPTRTLESSYLPALTTALKAAYPHKDVNITLDFFIKAHRTQMPGKGLASVKNTIAIASGKGGVGKSTIAVNLACALAQAGARVGILDADIYGPSIPMMLGNHAPVALEGERYLPIQVHGMQAMSIAYLTKGSPALIWRGPMLAKSMLQMLDITLWDNLDYLFIDLPPGTGDIQLSLVQKIPLTAAIVVTTPQNIATLDADKAIQMFQRMGIDVLGLVENMSYHLCSHCGEKEHLFGRGGGEALAKHYDLPLLGQIPLDARIQTQCDAGVPFVLSQDSALALHIMKTAFTAAMLLAQKPLNYTGKLPPVVIER